VFVNDQPIMARGKVRYVGEAVAAVAAEDVITPAGRSRLIKVEYEAAAGGVRSRRGDGRRRAGPARLPRRTTSSSTSRSARAMSRRLRRGRPGRRGDLSDAAVEHAYLEPEAGLAYVDHDGVVTVHLAEPEHHPSPPHAGAHPGAADQQGALHHEPGGRRLRRQGGHDLPGHAGAAGDEDRPAGAPRVHPRGIDRLDRQAPSLAHPLPHGADARRPHHRERDHHDLRRRRLRAVDRRA
jgi:hypothetical protein